MRMLVLSGLCLIAFGLGGLVGINVRGQIVQAAPAEQITINTRDPQLKNIYLLGSVGDCDMYFVVVDISIAADHQQVITVCGADREAR